MSAMQPAVGPVTSKKLPTLVLAVVTVWISVGVISVFSPDLVSGSQQDHLPLAAMTAWLWGAVATGLIVIVAVSWRVIEDAAWTGFGATVVAIWVVAAVVAVFGPELVTGADPTRIPISALVAPMFGALATGFASAVFVLAARR